MPEVWVKLPQNGTLGDRFEDEFVSPGVFASILGLDPGEVEERLRQAGVECRSKVLRRDGSKFIGFRAVEGMNAFTEEAKGAGWQKVGR